MQLHLLERMVCPYCGGGFRVRRAVAGDGDRLTYGLLECRCFVFPVVDGILLLSLAKAYGGPEEAVQPHLPLLVAAVRHLEGGDIAGLQGWIRDHAPVIADVMADTGEPYLQVAARLRQLLADEVDGFLDSYGRFGVLGTPRRRMDLAVRRARRAFRTIPASATEEPLGPNDFYSARYFSPRVNALALQFDAFPPAARLLSLCCGHGVLETLLRAGGHAGDVVSLDGQLLNVLVARRFAGHGGTYICHDVQYPLPFRDGAFNGVFSSTCVPEIPPQRMFVSEAVRVTTADGWTAFDSIWGADVDPRIQPKRHYRFAQNLFARLEDYVPLFDEVAGPERRLGVCVSDAPSAFLEGPGWMFGAAIESAMASRGDVEISTVVLGPSFPGWATPMRRWLRPGSLAASHVFDATRTEHHITLSRRATFATLTAAFAPKQFAGYPEHATIDLRRVDQPDYLTELFTAALINVAPPNLTTERERVLRPAEPGDAATG